MEANDDKVNELIGKMQLVHNTSLSTFENLKGLVKNPCDVGHFRRKNGLKKLLEFIDVKEFQAIALSLIANCCTEVESSILVVNSEIHYKIVGILDKEKDTYILKSASRVLGIMFLHRECHWKLHEVPEVERVLVECLDKHSMDEHFLFAHLKTIEIMSRSHKVEKMLASGVTCKLSRLLSKPFSRKLLKLILYLIYNLLNRKWESNFDTQENCRSTLKELTTVMGSSEEISKSVFKYFLSHFSSIVQVRPFIGSSGALHLLVDSLKSSKSRSYRHYMLGKLYKILTDPLNRWHFYDEGGLELMLLLMKDSGMRPTLPLVLQILCLFTDAAEYANYLMSHKIISFCIELVKDETVNKLLELTHKLLHDGDIADEMDEENTINREEIGMVHKDRSENSSSDNIPGNKITLSLKDPVQNIQEDKIVTKSNEHSRKDCLLKHAFSMVYHLRLHPGAERQLNSATTVRSLVCGISEENSWWSVLIIDFLSRNPLYFKLFLSEMVVPMMHLFYKDFMNCRTLGIQNNLNGVCNSNYAPTILRELLSADHTRLQCAISLCYLARKGSRGESYMTEAGVMEGLVNSMYDHKHPLRLLSITSYCHLLSSVSAACECDIEEDDDEEGEKEEEEREYDVSFMLGQECIRSVKSKLVCHSEVFRVMFEGAFREASTHQVVVDGASPEAFRFFNESLLSGRFNPLLFEVDNADTLLGVLQLANKYLVRRLEGRIVSLVCSNMPVYFDAVIRSNSFLASRPLLVRCILHVCQEIINADKYELIIYFFKYISKQDFTELSIKLTNLYCIHNA